VEQQMTVIRNEFTTHPPSYDDDPQREAIKLIARNIIKGEMVHRSELAKKPTIFLGTIIVFFSGYLFAAGPKWLPLLSSILPPSMI